MSEYIIDYDQIPLKWRDGYGLSDVDLTEEIVRCRDCERYEHAEVHRFDGVRRREPTCTRLTGCAVETQPDGFCAWGKKKVDR